MSVDLFVVVRGCVGRVGVLAICYLVSVRAAHSRLTRVSCLFQLDGLRFGEGVDRYAADVNFRV